MAISDVVRCTLMLVIWVPPSGWGYIDSFATNTHKLLSALILRRGKLRATGWPCLTLLLAPLVQHLHLCIGMFFGM